MVLRSLEKNDVLAGGLAEIEPESLRQAARDVIERWPEGDPVAAVFGRQDAALHRLECGG